MGGFFGLIPFPATPAGTSWAHCTVEPSVWGHTVGPTPAFEKCSVTVTAYQKCFTVTATWTKKEVTAIEPRHIE